jgi:hypothetical protein
MGDFAVGRPLERLEDPRLLRGRGPCGVAPPVMPGDAGGRVAGAWGEVMANR